MNVGQSLSQIFSRCSKATNSTGNQFQSMHRLKKKPGLYVDKQERTFSEEMPIERIEVVGMDGRMMTVENNVNNYNRTIDVSTYPSGNYIVKIYFEEGLVTKQADTAGQQAGRQAGR